VPGDIIHSLVNGFQKEFFSGNPTPGTPNAITGLLKLLTGILGPLGGLGDILDGLPDLVAQQISPLAATAVSSAASHMVTLSTNPDGDVSTGKHAAAADTPVPDDTGAAAKHAVKETGSTQEEDEGTGPTTKPADDTTKDTSTSSTSTPEPKPATPKNPVGTVVGGVTHEVAGVVGGVTAGVTNGLAGVLKSLAPKTTTSKSTADTTTETDSKPSTEKKADAA
jgi:hypothetical protein